MGTKICQRSNMGTAGKVWEPLVYNDAIHKFSPQRCVPSHMLSGFLQESIDKAFMVSFILENAAVREYPAMLFGTTRASCYDDLLKLQSH